MIWNDTKLRQACSAAQPLVSPLDAACINPASIDLRLGCEFRRWQGDGWGQEVAAPMSGTIVMEPGEFLLCCSLETVCIPTNACAALYSKSSTGRRGIEHLHAGWIDPGFCGQLTWELKNVTPHAAVLVVGSRLMQMVVTELLAPAAVSYAATGRYQNQTGATPAREVRP